ncbi:hypothetical protein AWB81_08379 [Caballeronia arationis]|nr:hypothetical protein AWB81_08379 [Caballeronia arationis]
MRTRAIGVARQRSDGVLDFLPEGRLEIAGDARSRVFRALSRERKRVAGQIPRLHQPRKQCVENDDRLALTRGRQGAIERPPPCIVARVLATTAGDPGRGGLRIGQELLVAQTIFVGERRERLVERHKRPEQQALGFLAITLEGGLGVVKAREPRANRIEIMVGRDLRTTVRRAIRPDTTVERRRNHEGFEGRGLECNGCRWRKSGH